MAISAGRFVSSAELCGWQELCTKCMLKLPPALLDIAR